MDAAGSCSRAGPPAGGRRRDLLVLCTNTMHKVADQVEAAVTIPLVHLATPPPRRYDGPG